VIQFYAVTKQYDNARPAVVDLSLHIRPGEFVALVGESGSGKTTTLKMINRLVEATSGEIHVDGQPVSRQDPVALRRRIGYVFQGIGLFPHMTVGRNVSLVMRMLGWEENDINRRIDELLELVSLPPQEYRHRLPSELSGGQQQRVGVARALAVKPKILLMDEPFGALDPITRDSMQDELRALQQQLKLTVVMVTHDMTEALLMADRVGVMERGCLLRVATPRELMLNPADPYVERLIAMPRRHAERMQSIRQNESGLQP